MWTKEKRDDVIDTLTKFFKDIFIAIFNHKPNADSDSETDDTDD
jgi:hypothetical protein